MFGEDADYNLSLHCCHYSHIPSSNGSSDVYKTDMSDKIQISSFQLPVMFCLQIHIVIETGSFVNAKHRKKYLFSDFVPENLVISLKLSCYGNWLSHHCFNLHRLIICVRKMRTSPVFNCAHGSRCIMFWCILVHTPFLHGSTLISGAWLSNHMPCIKRDEITYSQTSSVAQLMVGNG